MGSLCQKYTPIGLSEGWDSSYHQYNLHSLWAFLKMQVFSWIRTLCYLLKDAHLKSDWLEKLVYLTNPLPPTVVISLRLGSWKNEEKESYVWWFKKPQILLGRQKTETWIVQQFHEGLSLKKQVAEESNRDTRSQVSISKKLTLASGQGWLLHETYRELFVSYRELFHVMWIS